MLVQRSYQIQQLDHVPANMLEDMLSLIKQTFPLEDDKHKILPRSKYILTELVTNAIKHVNTGLTDITIRLTDNAINIIKKDKGDRISLPQIKSDVVQNGSVITVDIMHTLYSVTKSERMHFYCYEHDEPNISDENNYPEHFGLLIITKSSDEFFYTHNTTENTNVFSATIDL